MTTSTLLCLNVVNATNNTKKAYQLVKTLTKQQQGKVNNIQDKEGKCLTEVEDKTIRWTEYCSELYTFQNKGDTSVLFWQLAFDQVARWSSGYDAALSPSQPGFDSPSRNYAFFFSVNTRTICFLVTFHSASVAF